MKFGPGAKVWVWAWGRIWILDLDDFIDALEPRVDVRLPKNSHVFILLILSLLTTDQLLILILSLLLLITAAAELSICSLFIIALHNYIVSSLIIRTIHMFISILKFCAIAFLVSFV